MGNFFSSNTKNKKIITIDKTDYDSDNLFVSSDNPYENINLDISERSLYTSTSTCFYIFLCDKYTLIINLTDKYVYLEFYSRNKIYKLYADSIQINKCIEPNEIDIIFNFGSKYFGFRISPNKELKEIGIIKPKQDCTVRNYGTNYIHHSNPFIIDKSVSISDVFIIDTTDCYTINDIHRKFAQGKDISYAIVNDEYIDYLRTKLKDKETNN